LDKIRELQYRNLRKCVNKNLIYPILGEKYYNMAMDVYSADEETTKDLKSEFDFLKRRLQFYRVLSVLLSLFLIVGIVTFCSL